jgi:hypothetical protein
VPLSEQERAVLIALCRPIATSTSSTPATNVDIGEEIFLAVDAVKAHMRSLFDRFGLSDLPSEEKPAVLCQSCATRASSGRKTSEPRSQPGRLSLGSNRTARR